MQSGILSPDFKVIIVSSAHLVDVADILLTLQSFVAYLPLLQVVADLHTALDVRASGVSSTTTLKAYGTSHAL